MQQTVNQKIAAFFAKFPESSYKKGQQILAPGDKLDAILNIKSGLVKSYSINEGGFSLVLNIYKPNSFFPITEALAQRENPYYFEAITDCVLQKAPYMKVRNFLLQDSSVALDLTRRVSVGLEDFMIRTQYLMRSNAEQKITATLLLLARRFGAHKTGNQIMIQLPQTHADIANFAGCSRETASIELKKLSDQSLITSNKKIITLLAVDKLQAKSALYHESEILPYHF